MASGSHTLHALSRLARALPPAADPVLASLAGRAAARGLRARDRAVRGNLAAVFPDRAPAEIDRLAARTQGAYARFLLEYLRARSLPPAALARRIDLRFPASLQDALDAGRGLVVVTLHVGNWEVGALSLLPLGRPVGVVAGPQYARAWQETARRSKERAGIEVFGPTRNARPLYRHVAGGGILCSLIDGDVYHGGRRISLAGRSAMLPTGPAALAARTGAAITGALCLPVGPFRFRVGFEPLASSDRTPVRDESALFDAMTGWTERALRSHPGAWCVFRPFFEATPEPSVSAARTLAPAGSTG